jgi:hypothetical protein
MQVDLPVSGLKGRMKFSQLGNIKQEMQQDLEVSILDSIMMGDDEEVETEEEEADDDDDDDDSDE